MPHLQIKRPGERLGQAASRERDVDAIVSDFHAAKQCPEHEGHEIWGDVLGVPQQAFEG